MPNLSKNETLPSTATPPPQPATRGAARNFAAKILLFILPILLCIGVVELALWQTGETVPVTAVIARQQGNPRLIWLRAYFDQGLYRLKWDGFETYRPQILALGSSRVMKFRAGMFGRDAASFYNAGGLIQNVDDLNSFADALTPANTPRVVLLGVDFWWLNANRQGRPGLLKERYLDGALDWRAHWVVWRKMMKNGDNNKSSPLKNLLLAWRASSPSNALGIQARVQGEGFRRDGSVSNPARPPVHLVGQAFEDEGWQERITKGENQVRFTRGVSATRLKLLQRALTTLKRKGVTVLVFSPPLASVYARLMNSTPQQQRIWREFQTQLPELCRKLKITFCDASTPQKLGLQDWYMRDAVHAEETLHLYVLRAWLKDPQVRQAMPDALRAVNAALQSPRTTIWYADLGSSIARPNAR